MTINAYQQLYATTQIKSSSNCMNSVGSNTSDVSGNRGDFKTRKKFHNYQTEPKRNNISPYLNEKKVQVISRVEKLVHKRRNNFMSSFPMAVNIYKANSGELKNTKKKGKKIKKSVLTLPNKPAPLPQTCTVSDMNDSEYFSPTKVEISKPVKRKKLKTNRKYQDQSKEMSFFGRDAQYCVDLDCSSSDLFENFTGMEKRKTRKQRNRDIGKCNVKAHDVWSILRNMNRFQFQSSAPNSEDNVTSSSKKTCNKRRGIFKDTRFVESCQTEEFAYISSYEIDNNSYSQSSCDRVTVIGRHDKMNGSQELLKSLPNNSVLPKTCKKNKTRKAKPFKDNTKVENKKENIVDVRQCVTTTTNLNPALCETDKDEQQTTTNNTTMNNQCNKKLNIYPKKICLVNRKQSVSLECKQDIINLEDSEENRDFEKPFKSIDGNIKSNNSLNVVDDHNTTDSCRQKKIVSKNAGNLKDYKIESLSGETMNEPKKEINGITNVLFNKGDVKTLLQPRVSRMTTLAKTTPNLKIPKLTQADIKRRIANIRFPLVILEKDQLRSPICITNYEPPQFLGLEKHIWPFMVNWVNNGYQNKTKHLQNVDTTNHKTNSKWFSLRSFNNLNLPSQSKPVNISNKRISSNNDSIKENGKCKAKSFKLKEKMLSLITGKNETSSVSRKGLNGEQDHGKLKCRWSDISTQTETHSKNETKISNKVVASKYPWSKGNWASDFIENVLKKIKNGEYFTQELKDQQKCALKEDSTQTNLQSPEYSASDVTPKVYIEMKNDTITNIPGFDDAIPELEIETFNKDQIAIKHCDTDVVLKFDIIVSRNGRSSIIKNTRLVSYVPIAENQKVFKYNNTIVNAVLPAELCTIIPKVMRNLIDFSRRLEFPQLNKDKMNSQLQPISSPTNCKFSNVLSPFINFKPNNKLETKRYCEKKQILPINIQQISNNDIKPILTHNFISGFIMNIKRFIYKTVILKRNTIFITNNDVPLEKHLTGPIRRLKDNISCKSLQLYLLSKKAIVPAYRRFTFADFMENFNYFKNEINKLIYIHRIIVVLTLVKTISTYYGKEINPKESKMIGYNLQIDSIFQISQNRRKCRDSISINSSKSDKTLVKCKLKSSFVRKKSRKISYVRLYRHCKSMSNLPQNNSVTSLDKIAGIDDFLQALGLSKTLTSVLDGSAEKKIISSLAEMKNWISSITSRQALLVMLLCNKKDTSNLARYRPIILQGIAVNRITRVSELDMEIEVIEKEKMNTLLQCEGITYLPASLENQGSLYEELYWIAKTTASDYQKPFDEHSERLLKSLLEKRKTLNPSYLRVMARYVGLGLLKSSK